MTARHHAYYADPDGFACLPARLLRDRALPRLARLLYGLLALHCGPDGRCWPGVRSLASGLGCSDRTVQRALRTLCAGGYLFVERRSGPDGAEATSVYQLRPADVAARVEKLRTTPATARAPVSDGTPTPVNRDTPPGDTDDTPPVTPMSPEPDPVEPDKRNNPPTPHGGAPSVSVRSGMNGHRKNKPQPRVAPPASADARELHAYWQHAMAFPDRSLTTDRLRHLHARLREGMTVAKGKRAIDGCRASPFHMGDNDRAQPYNEIENIFRNAKRVDEMCARAEAGAGVRTSALSPDVEKLAAKFRPKDRA